MTGGGSLVPVRFRVSGGSVRPVTPAPPVPGCHTIAPGLPPPAGTYPGACPPSGERPDVTFMIATDLPQDFPENRSRSLLQLRRPHAWCWRHPPAGLDDRPSGAFDQPVVEGRREPILQGAQRVVRQP